MVSECLCLCLSVCVLECYVAPSGSFELLLPFGESVGAVCSAGVGEMLFAAGVGDGDFLMAAEVVGGIAAAIAVEFGVSTVPLMGGSTGLLSRRSSCLGAELAESVGSAFTAGK